MKAAQPYTLIGEVLQLLTFGGTGANALPLFSNT